MVEAGRGAALGVSQAVRAALTEEQVGGRLRVQEAGAALREGRWAEEEVEAEADPPTADARLWALGRVQEEHR